MKIKGINDNSNSSSSSICSSSASQSHFQSRQSKNFIIEDNINTKTTGLWPKQMNKSFVLNNDSISERSNSSCSKLSSYSSQQLTSNKNNKKLFDRNNNSNEDLLNSVKENDKLIIRNSSRDSLNDQIEPLPPSILDAKLDLLKQLKLFLELVSYNDQARRVNASNNSSLVNLKQHKQNITIDPSVSPSKNVNLYIDEDVEENSCLGSPNATTKPCLNRNYLSIKLDDKKVIKNFMISPIIATNPTISAAIALNRTLNKALFQKFDSTKPLIPLNAYYDHYTSNTYYNEPFIGREWVFKEIDKAFESNQLVVVTGQSGSGKTKIASNLFRLSSVYQNTYIEFNNTSNKLTPTSSSMIKKFNGNTNAYNILASSSSSMSTENHLTTTQRYLASNLACIHYCLVDDMRTLDTTQFLINLAWCLSNFDGLNKPSDHTSASSTSINGNCGSTTPSHHNLYKQMLIENNYNLLNKLINGDTLKLDCDLLLKKCILDPLELLVNTTNQMLKIDYFYILMDGLDNCLIYEDGYLTKHNNLTNLIQFLNRNLKQFPKFIKFLFTTRNEESIKTNMESINYYLINLNSTNSNRNLKLSTSSSISLNENDLTSSNSFFSNNNVNSCCVNKDLNDYIMFRINKSIEIQKNILYFNSNNNSQSNETSVNGDATHNYSLSPNLNSTNNNFINKCDSNFQYKFTQHLCQLSQSNYLFAKLTLDLIEKGNLIIKSANFKVLPKSFDDLIKLYFNLKFQSRLSYDRLASILFSLILASAKPLNLEDLYESINCAYLTNEKITYNDLNEQINSLDGFIQPFLYYDCDLDILNNFSSNKGTLNRALSKFNKPSCYIFTHNLIRDWWRDYHNSKCTNTFTTSINANYDLRWINFLLAIRLFRSNELNQRINTSFTYETKIKLLIHHMKYLIKSHQIFSNCETNSNNKYDVICYLINLYLPTISLSNNEENAGKSSRNIYTNILISSDFLSMPDLDLFRVLIKLGADYNTNISYFNNSPFICVLARLGHIHLLSELIYNLDVKLDGSANISKVSTTIYQKTSQTDCCVVDQIGTNCLCYATIYAQVECCKFIIKTSKDPINMITQLDSNGYCALTYSSSSKHDSSQLLEYYVNLILKDDLKNFKSIKTLLEQSLVLSSLNANKNCLSYLIKLCFMTLNKFDNGISIDVIDSLKGETPLTAACSNGHKNICKILIEEANASCVAYNSKSWTPLLCAVKSGAWEIVEYLLSKNVEIINQPDKHGRNALILAASEGHLAIIDILIEKGANLSSCDRDGLSALSWACLKGHFNASLTLLNNNVDINHADYSGRTPLDLATFFGDVRLVQLLVERGAQIEHVDKIGMRPLDRAIGCRNVPVVICFLKKGAKLGPATWAMALGKPEIIITLLNKLVEDGNTLYRKGNYVEALHRYSYTLKKFPKDPNELAVLPDNVKAIIEMKFNLLLNLARCHRKLEDNESSIDLCTKAIELKSDSYEAFYSRARAKRDLKQFESALEDLAIASKLCTTNSDIKKLINKINEEMNGKSNNSTLKHSNKEGKEKHKKKEDYNSLTNKSQKQQQQTQTQTQSQQPYLIESPPL